MKPRLAGVIVVLALCGACAQPGETNNVPTSVSMMTFNVENLFDTQHDAGKNDYTYLPADAKGNDRHRERCKTIRARRWQEECLYWDWNEQVLAYRLDMTASVIRQVNEGKGADIVVFQEVENKGVLERLRREYLGGMGYRETVLIEGNDLRGIDVAFVSRFPLYAPPVLHAVDFREIEERRRDDTRGILQADFVLADGSVLTGFAVHFPAPFHHYRLRIDSYDMLNRLLQDLPAGRLAFAAGDFNTPTAEDQDNEVLDRYVKPNWLIAHQISCKDCKGTHYYAPEQEWSFLDMILIRRWSDGKAASAPAIDIVDTRVISGAANQLDAQGFPARFQMDPRGGISDHLPLLTEVEFR